MGQILIFGDSITYGAWDIEGGWVQRLRKMFDVKPSENPNGWNIIYNLGVSGDNSIFLRERFTSELESRIDPGEETSIIFSIGINDSQINLRNKKTRVSVSTFTNNILWLIEHTKQTSQNIIFLGLTAVDETKTKQDPLKAYTNDSIKTYDEELKRLCSKSRIEYLELFTDFESNSELLFDGLHPNDKGHELIFEKVKKYLINKKLIHE